MSNIAQWKSIFAQREKVAVEVKGKTEMLTNTQAYRFKEISEERNPDTPADYVNPLDDTQYKLADAAFRLMIPEGEVLSRAEAGSLRLYVDMSGQSGHWARRDPEGNVSRSSVSTIRSGLLKLRAEACRDLAQHGRAIVKTLDLCNSIGAQRANLDHSTLSNLLAWGPGDKQFSPLHPITVERSSLLLLPPLA